MGKVKISNKRKKSSTKSKAPILIVHDPYDARLADVQLIKKAVLQCLVDGDIESIRDLLIAHLNTVNKLKLAKKAKLGRQTIYDLMDMNKEFNPSLKTLTTILNNLAA
jgi:DNA-binding phage protein